MKEKHVKVDDRHFVVKFDDCGPRIIYERCAYEHAPYIKGVHNKGYWHREHHKPGSAKTLVSQILAKVAA